ncbi:MAG TPA: sugar dehydrogenase complex small subunit [Ignavibacteria bacterium]|nr:hypothetical protein [Bacteroidota bacterium]HRE09601.1 sugar dehydrogenase complex small subunit [Ignavibacteria bacterium]HRF64380.1 sugar dehydrogenase complex small subunit [Ignavibacteria bacterium]HRJ03893.1 sugar dehydrogenase complex small subunit [Ignavibacteria bacterium]HRJ84349.1 sugar dehydrogenase complex small subunit [Ignavibacteria bacterium]
MELTRRKFITICSLGAAALTLAPVMQACTKTSELNPDQFLKLSAILTGFKEKELDVKLAETYMNSLNDFPPSKAGLGDIYKTIGLGDGEKPTPPFIEGTLFTDPEEKILADTLIQYWYTGTYKDASGMKSASYQNQLAWKSTGYLIPNAQCRGTFGFWADKPNIA